MPWFRPLRDDLTLSPFEDQPSEGVAMVSAPADVCTNQEPAEEECPGKKKSKFQTFKKFFRRKRRKAPPGGEDLKCSVSSDDLSKSQETPSLRKDSGKKNGSDVGLGSRAQSHDSVFASDWSEAHEALGASQDSLHGKVKSLQMQLKQAMRPSLLCVKRTEDNGAMSEDDGLPCSPPEEYTPIKTQPQRSSSVSLDSAEEQSWCPGSSRVVSPLVVAPGDFSSPASASVCLDSSAARHKLGLRQRAQRRRRPVARLELTSNSDSVLDDSLNSSSADDSGAAADEELKHEEAEVTVELSGAEDSEETSAEPCRAKDQDMDRDQDQDLDQRLIQDKDQDLDRDSEGDDMEDLDSPGWTPEPPAGEREYLLDPLGFTSENRLSESSLEDKLGEEGEAEGESSLLLEVLSSLKTPLPGLDVPLMDHHQGETETERAQEETQEAAGGDNDDEDNQERKVDSEKLEVEADVQEVDASFSEDDGVRSAEEESKAEPILENTKEHGDNMAEPTKYPDNEEEETQYDLNAIDEHILGKQEEVEQNLDSIGREVPESEEEETQAAILVQEVQEETQVRETVAHDFKEESDGNCEIEQEIEMQISVQLVQIEDNFEVEEELVPICDESESEIVEFKLEQANMDEEEAVHSDEFKDVEEERDLMICKRPQRKTSTTTLEINLVSPNAEKHIRFSDGFEEALRSDANTFDQIEKTQERESVHEPMVEMEEVQELEDLGKTENEIEVYDRTQDESLSISACETEELQKQERLGSFEKDDETFENVTIPESKTPDKDSLAKCERDVGVFDRNDNNQDLEIVKESKVEMEEIEKEEFEVVEEVGILKKTQEETIKLSLNQSHDVENVESNQETSEKSKPEPSRPRFTVAAAWQRSLSAEEKDEGGPRTIPGTAETNKVPSESKPGSRPEFLQVQESRPESLQVQESTPESRPESGPEFLQFRESRPESRPEFLQVRESRPESRPESLQVQESRPESRPEFLQVRESRPESRPESLQVQESTPESRPEFLQVHESRPESRPEFLQVRESRPESRPESLQVQESRPESRPEFLQVRESRPESRPESRSEFLQVQESRLESRPESRSESRPEFLQVQESRPESRPEFLQVQESKPEPRPEGDQICAEHLEKTAEKTPEESPAVEGITQSPFGVRLRRTQALQRFIAEDEHKQQITAKTPPPNPPFTAKTPPSNPPITAKTPPSNPPFTAKTPPPNPPITAKTPPPIPPFTPKTPPPNPPITAKTPPSNPPITAKTPPPNPPITAKTPPPIPPITAKTPPPNPPITAKIPPRNPPITAKPMVLNLPITNKLTVPNPPISAKPVLPRKPEAETVNKLKRTSAAGSEPPSWISVAKHKQKVYKENSPVTNKDETEKTTQEPSKVISLSLKPASLLSPPIPVPPTAPKPSHSCPSPASPPSPLPRVTSPQDEPPWMALAKKKAKAWSEMPQIVQ